LAQNPTCKIDQHIMYSSKLFNSIEKNYIIREKEALVMVCAFHKLGNKFTFLVDYMALMYLINKPQVSSRLARWFILFLEYDFKIV
jgi:hypothetical protein